VKPHPHRQTRIEISDIAFGGAGVGRSSDGKAVFVPYTINGEQVTVDITQRQKNFDRGRVIEIHQSSPHRVAPPCPYFARCGGCDYQHIDYPQQLIIKQRQVAQTLHRLGHLDDINVLPTIGSPLPYGFRNRITVHSDGARIGFFEKQSRTIIDIKQCALASSSVNAKLTELRSEGLKEDGHRTLREDAQSRTFSQTNDHIAERLLNYVADRVEGEVLLDGYCGSGFFGHQLANRFQTIVGIDWNEPAIISARKIAKENETYLHGDVGETIGAALQKYHPDFVILDPSADGTDERVTSALSQFAPASIIYISCNPATLARDLKRMAEVFAIDSVQPFDMFPQTAEIEAVATLRRR
jgi:23S rRNA (uracil1939-C5)-methyltransferase